MKRGLYTLAGLLLTCLFSCQKKDYDDSFTSFAPVYFVNKSALDLNLLVKYKGTSLEWDRYSGRIEVPEGEGVFEFFDRRNGQVLAEKKVTVSKDNRDSFLIFQPTIEAPLAFLDARGQADVTPPPAGFIKIKLANYAPSLLPFEKTDVIVVGVNMNFEFINLDTIMAVSQNMGNEEYHLVPTTSDMMGYTFYFKQNGTETKVKNNMGDDYLNIDNALIPDFMNPRPEKNIYTLYFSPLVQPYPGDNFIKLGDKYYHINPEILYAN